MVSVGMVGVVCVGDGKERLTVTVDPVVLSELDEVSDNRSAVINRLLEEYVKSGGDGPIALEVKHRDCEKRIEQALNERDRVNRRIERLREQKELLEREMEARQDRRREKLLEARKYVEGRDVDNPAVQNWAEKLGMTPPELKRKIEQLGVEQ